MNYRVVWRRRAVHRLNFWGHMAWETGRGFEAIDRAAADINLRLSDDPASEGESREGAERVVISDPLTVVYEVFEARQTVVIYDLVHHQHRRG